MEELKKNSNIKEKSSKGRKNPVILIAAVSLAVIVIAASLMILFLTNGGEEDNPPITGDWSECGTYYSVGDSECELTLIEGGTFTLIYDGNTTSGSYTLVDGALTLDFSADGEENAVGEYSEGVVTLTYRGTTVRLIEKVSYTVKFETNGGTNMEAVTVLNGKTLQKPDDPIRENYIFVGWYKDSEYTQPFTFSADIVTSDITIYARWVENTGAREYTVSFDLGFDGSTAFEPKTTVGGRIFGVPTPERIGFEFGGWWISTEDDATALSYKWNEEIGFKKDTTLFAVWYELGSTKIEAPSLRLEDDGIYWDPISDARSYDVTVSDSKGTVIFSRSVSTESVNFVFADYEAGVYRIKVVANAKTGEEDNSESYYVYVNKGLDKVSGLFVSGNATLVFEGVDNAEKYLITVVCGNGEHRHTDLDNGNSKTFSFANCSMPEEGIRFIVKAVADGYLMSVSDEFVYKRNLSAVSDLAWNDQTSIMGWSAVDNAEYYVVSVSCGDPLHTHVGITVDTFVDLKGCSGEITVSVYPFAEGYALPKPAEKNITKSALKTPGEVTVIGGVIAWEANDKASGYEISVNGTVYETKENRFDLSTAMTLGSGKAYEIKLRSVGEISSVWSEAVKCYTDTLGGAPKYSYGKLIWNHVIDADFYEIQVNDGEVTRVYGRNFSEILFDRVGENTVKLRYSNGDGCSEWVSLTVSVCSVSFDTLGGNSVGTMYIAEGDVIKLPDATRKGYNFVSWYNVPGGPTVNGKELSSGMLTVRKDVVFYAHYTPERYEIKYNYGLGGTGLGVNGSVEYERDYILEVPTSDDMTVAFGGWFSAPYGKGIQYTDGSGNSLAPWSALGGAEVYAFWIDETLSFASVKVNGKEAYSVSAGPRISLVTEVTVPAYHNGLPVAMIDGNAFAGCGSLKKINIPATLEVISNLDPFAECDSLVEINVYAVDGFGAPRYSSRDGVLFENKSGKSALLRMPIGRAGEYSVPTDTSEILEGAFSDSAIGSVIIASEVTKIGNDAFEGCRELRSVTFAVSASGGEKELSIGKRAFGGCVSLNSIILPARLADIDLSKYYISASGSFVFSRDYAFVDCDSLESISVAEGSESYSVVDGMICSADGRQILYCPTAKSGEISLTVGTQSISAGAFIGCDGITDIFIPNTVTYIGEYAFYGLSVRKVTFGGKGFSSVTVGDNAFARCEKLTDVEFETGSQVAVIGEKAFSGCTGLSEFTISTSVTSIRDNAFENCTSLKTVNFDGGKKSLEFGKNVFYNCSLLTTVRIPENVSSIPGIFSGCTSLTEVKVDEGNPHFISNDGIVFSKDMTEIVYYPQGRGGEYSIPDTVTSIAAGVFSGNKSLTKLIIPNSVSHIGEEAFKNTKIGMIVFDGENRAESLTVARAAFENAYFEGYDFVLPSHTKIIEAYAFAGIFYQKIVLNEGLETIGDYAFYCPSNDNGGTLVIPSTVTAVGEYCFSGESIDYYITTAHRFMNVEFTKENSKLITIGDHAFHKNAKLVSLELPNSVKKIGNYAFYECVNLTDVTLSESLETIGAYAFAASANTYQVPISTLTVPASVSSIGARAFENCQLLTTVTFKGTVDSPDLVLGAAYRRSYESDGVEMFSVERGMVFESCTRLVSVDLSPNVTTLGDYCFASSGDTGFKVNVPSDSRLATVGAFCFYKSRLESFTVPASVRNLEPVEEYGMVYNRLGIGDYAFAVSSGRLTGITFLKDGNSYPLTIGYGAFENQSKLEAIELPARLAIYVSADGEVIAPLANGPLVFYGAKSLSSVTAEAGGAYKVEGGVLYTSDMKELVFCPVSYVGSVFVPASVAKIHEYALCGCSQVTDISFADSSKLNFIGEYAFFGCSSVKSLVLPSGVSFVGAGAFNNNLALEDITLPKALVSFDIAVMNGCSSLKNIFVESGNISFASENGVLYNLNGTELLMYPTGREDKEYAVKGSVLSIGKQAFSGNGWIEAVVLPNSLREINEGAFANCHSLKLVTLPNTVEIIGSNAFADTVALEKLIFAKGGVTKLVIADGAFKNSAVASLELPSRLAAIGAEAFLGSGLSSLVFEAADTYCLTDIGGLAFADTLLVSVNFPNGIVNVGEGLFLGTSTLDEVFFGNGLENVGAEAFKDSSVKRVSFPSSLVTLGARAFYNCRSLTDVSFGIGSRLQIIEEGTFYGCDTLESITVPSLVERISGESNNGAFYNCTALKTVTFESNDNCTVIGNYAFYGCESLFSFDIPMSTGTLGDYAFSGCTSLTEIVIHRATVKLGKGLFEGCKKLVKVELDSGADVLPERMFENCESLSRITIPASVSEIGDACFRGTSIEEFEIADGNKNFVSVNGIIYNASKTSIVCFPPKLNAKVLIIPKEIVEIKSDLFRNCTGIKEVIFEEGGSIPLSIGSHAFDGCYQLRRVTFPERLSSIGSYAFKDCVALTSVTIPKNVESIGDYAFSGCGKLYEVRNESSIEDIAKKGSLNYINNNYYSNAKVNIYTPTEGSSVIFREGEFLFATVNGTKRLIGYEGNDSVVTLPNGDYSVADYLFYMDDSVTRVIIPKTVQISGSFLFSGCDSLEVIFVSGGEVPEAWPNGWNNGKAVFGGYSGVDVTYTFITNGSEPIADVKTSDMIKLPTPELQGHIFIGWYDNADFNGTPVFENYYSAEKTALYARFITEEAYVELYLRGQTMEYAYDIEDGKVYKVDIREKGAKNYYKITVGSGEKWNISTPSGMGYHKIWIYDENGKEIFSYYSGATYDPSHDINYDYVFSKGGTYYIGVGYKSSTKAPGEFEVTFTKK